MKVFCINMKDATDRRAHCEEQFAKAGLTATFVRGFEGRASKLRHEQDWISQQVGVCISHYMVNEEIKHSKINEPVLVFEDDILLKENFRIELGNAIKRLPFDWHIAALSWFVGEGYSAQTHHLSDVWCEFISGDIWGCGAYLVNGYKGAEAVLNCITPIRSHIDRMLWECCRDGLMNGYFHSGAMEEKWQRGIVGLKMFASQNV